MIEGIIKEPEELNEVYEFLFLKKKARLESITPEICFALLAMFGFPISYSKYTACEIEELKQLLSKIEFCFLEPSSVLNPVESDAVYVFVKGVISTQKSTKELGKEIKKIRYKINNEKELFHFENNKKRTILKEITHCISTVQALKLDKHKYRELKELIEKIEKKILIIFLEKLLKMKEEIKDYHLIHFEIIYKKKGEELNLKLKDIIVVESGEILLHSEKNKKLKLTENCIVRCFEKNGIKLSFSEDSRLVYMNERNIANLEKIFPGLEEQFEKTCENYESIRLNNNKKIIEESMESTIRYANMNVKDSSIGKRFRRTKRETKDYNETREFMSNLPYERIVDSEEYLRKTCKRKKGEKIMAYLKINQLRKKNKNEKIAYLKIRSKVKKCIPSQREPTIPLKMNIFDEEELRNESFFTENDTGLINQMVRNSKVYQKEINYLLTLNKYKNLTKEEKIRKPLNKKDYLHRLGVIGNIKEDEKNYIENRSTYETCEGGQERISLEEKSNSSNSIDKESETMHRKLRNTFCSTRNTETQCKTIVYNNFISQGNTKQKNFTRPRSVLKRLNSGKIVTRTV